MRAQGAQAQLDPSSTPGGTPPAPLDDATDALPTVVHGRHTVVPERFRAHATAKLRTLTRFDHRIIRLEVEVSSEHNPRQSHTCERVQVTCVSRGPVVRAEAAAQDAYTALDLAVAKLEERLRRAADRRHSRGARIARLPQPRTEPPLPSDPALSGPGPSYPARSDAALRAPADATPRPDDLLDGAEDGPFLVREKVHEALPMTLDEALANMELVGHDFYLFRDAGCGSPSVVYRRRGYHYGVLRLGDAPADSGR